MTPKPMIFTAENVPLLMTDLKTNSRRIMRVQPDEDGLVRETASGKWYDTSGREYKPPHQPGDIVYVAEGYQIHTELTGCSKPRSIAGWYLADHKSFSAQLTDPEYKRFRARSEPWRKNPAIHMYRSLARTYLEILDVKAERIQDISEEDAIAEGCQCKDIVPIFPQDTFRCLWNSIHGPDAWDRNDWVWAYTFKPTGCRSTAI